MDHLRTELAPISTAAWAEINAEATRVLKQRLAARRLIDFTGHDDWSFSSVPRGRVGTVQTGDVTVSTREVIRVVELRVDFTMSRSEIDAVDRGASDFDTAAVIAAAVAAAKAEDSLVFDGNEGAGIVGIASCSSHPAVDLRSGLISAVAEAVEVLRSASVAGPHALAVGDDVWVDLVAGSDRGYPVMSHLDLLIDGPVVWAPSMTGALLVSQRGGDFAIESGQDWSIGYDSHSSEEVRLYLQESATVVVNTPEAAVRITGSADR